MANKLFIIGNGFDLAHGLPTSYNDFILWYLNDVRSKLKNDETFSDDLLKYSISKDADLVNSDYKSLKEFGIFNSKPGVSFVTKYPFFKILLTELNTKRWVDIEYQYYRELVKLYLHFEKSQTFSNDEVERQIRNLNSCFDIVKNKLIEYLKKEGSKIKDTEQGASAIPEIAQHFNDEFKNSHRNQSIVILNFNYTNTVNLYRSLYIGEGPFQIINIHGDLTNSKNPPIFGYGDETDSYYSKIEALNNNEMLKHIKSFNYLNSLDYKSIINFFNTYQYFEVIILGHSCGISDRLLFSTIVEDTNCKSIKIYYYQKSENENDFYEKTIELSRHFSKDFKKKFREIVIPLNESKPLISWKG